MTRNPESTEPTIAVTLNLNDSRRDLLMSSCGPSFLADQPDRFLVLDGPEPDRTSNVGIMYACDTGVAVLFLEAYEQARGRNTYLLSDEGMCAHGYDTLVVLSIEPEHDTGSRSLGPTGHRR